MFNLHPWKWFEECPVESTLSFSGWQKHLSFSRVATWEKAGFHKVNQKKNGCHALKSLKCFWNPEKNRVDFTGCPSNHFSGIRLNGQLCDKSQKHFQYNKMNIISKNSRQKFWSFTDVCKIVHKDCYGLKTSIIILVSL